MPLNNTAILGVDWGSSSMRAMRIGRDGGILDVRRADDGVITGRGDFEARLRVHLGDWLALAPILLCGMIGSDRGWCRAAYVPAPAGLDVLAAALATPPFPGSARIVPGVSLSNGDEAEVMRGEETIAMGFCARTGLTDATLCLPGTHSKWVRIRNGRIDSFRTYMTGELRALVLAQGALATDVEQRSSPDALNRGLASEGALTRRLFQARARRLLGRLPAEHTASFVSGVLVGEEVAAEARQVEAGVPVYVAANGTLAETYGAALRQAGIAHTTIDPEKLTAHGLVEIARRSGLLAAE